MFRSGNHDSRSTHLKKIQSVEGRAGTEIEQDITSLQSSQQLQQTEFLRVSNVCHERHAAVARYKSKIGHSRFHHQLRGRTLHSSAQVFADTWITILESEQTVKV